MSQSGKEVLVAAATAVLTVIAAAGVRKAGLKGASEKLECLILKLRYSVDEGL